MIKKSHWGQHSPDCYGCKLQFVTLDTGAPKTHVKKGDPWEGNPVAERIEELRAAGRKVAAFELSNPASNLEPSSSAPTTTKEQ